MLLKKGLILHVLVYGGGEMFEIIHFLLVPRLLVVVIIEESDFNTRYYCNHKFYDSSKGKNGDLHSYMMATNVAI